MFVVSEDTDGYIMQLISIGLVGIELLFLHFW